MSRTACNRRCWRRPPRAGTPRCARSNRTAAPGASTSSAAACLRSRRRPSPRPRTTCRQGRARDIALLFPQRHTAPPPRNATVPGPARAHRALASRPRGVGRRVPSAPDARSRVRARPRGGQRGGSGGGSPHRNKSMSTIASSARAPTAGSRRLDHHECRVHADTSHLEPSVRPSRPADRPTTCAAGRKECTRLRCARCDARTAVSKAARASGRPAGRDQAVTATRPLHPVSTSAATTSAAPGRPQRGVGARGRPAPRRRGTPAPPACRS